jgi:hypothetical protein
MIFVIHLIALIKGGSLKHLKNTNQMIQSSDN